MVSLKFNLCFLFMFSFYGLTQAIPVSKQAEHSVMSFADINSQVLAAAKLLKKGDHALACSVLKNLPKKVSPRNQLMLNIQFLLGQCSAGLGLYQDAQQYFEKVVELDPNQARPHLDLALVYQYTGDYRAATKQYNTLLDMPNVQPKVKNKIEYLLDNRPDALRYHVEFSAGLIVDSNVNNGPTSETIDIYDKEFTFNIESLPISASGKGFGGALSIEKLLDRSSRLKGRISLTNAAYEQSDQYDSSVLDASILYSKKKGQAEFSIKPSIVSVTLGSEPLLSVLGVDGSMSKVLESGMRMNTLLGYQNFQYSQNSDINVQLLRTQLSFKSHYASSLILNSNVGFGIGSGVNSDNSYNQVSLGMGVDYSPLTSLLFTLSYQLNSTGYNGKISGFDSARNDIRSHILGVMSYNLKAWSMPRVTLETGLNIYDNRSNIEVYDSKRNQVFAIMRVTI